MGLWKRKIKVSVEEEPKFKVFRDEHGKWCITNSRRHYVTEKVANLHCQVLNEREAIRNG